MAESDYTQLDDDLDEASMPRGVTTGIPRPNGGGNFVLGFNSRVTSPGAAGYFVNKVNYSPTLKGASIRGCLVRYLSGGPTGFAPMLFTALQGTSVNDVGYLIGLENDSPARVVIRKGTIATGLPATALGVNGILARSTIAFTLAQWAQLRLDAITQPNNEVLLQAFYNDLDQNPFHTPVWTPIPGISDFVDDALQINTGSAPLLDGRGGFAFQTQDVTRRGAFKQIEFWRQL